ncbi:MAG: HAD-IIA family hydrolase [Anaerolineaceae bacterium]
MDIHQLTNIKALVLDMDGVLWRENEAIGDLPGTFARFEKAGLKILLATNNATKTQEMYIDKLASMGVALQKEQIINSAMGVAYLLKKRFPKGGPVYVIGEIGLTSALEVAGFYHSDQNPIAVIASMDRQINFAKLKQATLFIRRGIPFYATNPDRTFPTPEGLIPGAGALLAALVTASDVEPIIAGKPSPTLYEFALEKLGTLPEETLAVGDRVETDILGGQKAGLRTALVLSGIATRAEGLAWTPKIDLIVPELGDLL